MSEKTNRENVKLVDFKNTAPADDPDHVLDEAKGNFESVFLCGWDNEGELDVRCSTNINNKDVLWMLEKFKAKLMNGDYAPPPE